MRKSARRLRVPVGGRLGDQIMRRSRDAHRKLVKMFFLDSSHKQIKLTLTGYSIIVKGSGKKFSEQFIFQKII